MTDKNFILLGGRYYAVSTISSVNPLAGGDVIISFSQPFLRDSSGHPTTDLRVTGAEAQGVLQWIQSMSYHPVDVDWGLPDRMS